jgi:hypothetical protein
MTKWSSLAYTCSLQSSTCLPSLPMVKAWWWHPWVSWAPCLCSGGVRIEALAGFCCTMLSYATRPKAGSAIQTSTRGSGEVYERDDMWTRIGVSREGDERWMACCGPTW